MFYPFKVADPHSGVHYQLSDSKLAELSLAPLPKQWSIGQQISKLAHSVWAESLSNAPVETIAAVSQALQDLILASPTLRAPAIADLPEGRARRHMTALLDLWATHGDALPEGLETARHVLELPHGQFLDALPVVADTLDVNAPASMQALFQRLKLEFGSVEKDLGKSKAPEGTRLHAVQQGLTRPNIERDVADGSISFYRLRDVASCCDIAAARARALIEAGCPAHEIAVLTAGDTMHLRRAFNGQGVPLSGLPEGSPQRDTAGETLLQLLLTKRPPSPAMALASLCLSPLMPWTPQVGRNLAEEVIRGRFSAKALIETPEHAELWSNIRSSASSLAQLRFLLDRIVDALRDSSTMRSRLVELQGALAGEGTPDWETILRSVQVDPPSLKEPDRNLQGVSVWSEGESPWRACRHLLVVDFTEGSYPARPRANPLFLDSEIAIIAATTGIQMRGRASNLARSLALFDEQLQAVAETATFLLPARDNMGVRLSPAAGLSLIARAYSNVDDASKLITSLEDTSIEAWPITTYSPPPTNGSRLPSPALLSFPGRDLLSLRKDSEEKVLSQSPSRLEKLIVSPLAWLLGEMDAEDMSWAPEELDARVKGDIAHAVLEHLFAPSAELIGEQALIDAFPDAFERALALKAAFLRSAPWDMERQNLEREIGRAAQQWRSHLAELNATIFANEIRLAGRVHGIQIAGRTDCILTLPDGSIVIVDHKKSGSSGRRRRMEAGWDLQAGLYRDVLAAPIRTEGDGLDAIIGRTVSVAYHMMNDGGLLTSGANLRPMALMREMGTEVETNAVARLTESLAEVRTGAVRLNTPGDAAFFKKTAGFTPYALDSSPLIIAFMAEVQE